MSAPADDDASGPFRFFFTDFTFGSLLGILLVAGGLMAYQLMVKEANPDLAIPTVLVNTSWTGASPELVEQQVTTVLENELKTVPAVKTITSQSRTGQSSITVEFDADAPMEPSVQALRTKVASAAPRLPGEADAPIVEHISTSDVPVMTYVLFGQVSDAVLGNTAHDVKEHLEKLSAVRKVEIAGAREEEVRIIVNPLSLNAFDLSLTDLRQRIVEASSDTPVGALEGGPLAGDVTLAGRFADLDVLRSLPVKRLADGASVVRLSDVAEIRRGLAPANSKTFVSFAGDTFASGVTLQVFQTPGADTLRSTDAMKAAIAAFPFPAGIDTRITSDQSVIVSEKLSEVFVNGVQAVIAVVLVLVVMLSWREAAIAGLAVPITFLGALVALFAMGMTMNTIVIVGMVLALGLLVDVFILVMEGMHQGMKSRGLSFAGAARYTVKTFAAPAFAGQITTILALAPLLFLDGVSGKFIRLVPLTAIICLVISYLIAFLWAIPASRMLLDRKRKRPPAEAKPGPVDRAIGATGQALYGFLMRFSLRNRRLAAIWVALAVGLVAISLLFASRLGMIMYPPEDGRDIGITVALAPGTPLDETEAFGRRLADAIKNESYLDSVTLYIGQRSPYAGATSLGSIPGPHVIGLSLKLTPLEARNGRFGFTYADDLRQALDPLVMATPGARMAIGADTGGPSSDGGAMVVKLTGTDLLGLKRTADNIKIALWQVPGAVEISDDMGDSRYKLDALPNRDAMSFFGVSLSGLARELSLAMSVTKIADFRAPGDAEDVPVRMGVAWPGNEGDAGAPRTPEDLANLRIRAGDGSAVSIASLVFPVPGSVPPVIRHENGERTVTVRAVFAGDGLSQAYATAWPEIGKIVQAADGVQLSLGGSAAEQQETASRMLQLFVLTFFLMFATLVLLFNSYRLPVIILVAVPFALIGTFTGFFVIGMPISFPAMVGIVSLLGIVVNVTIVMVETMMEHVRDGKSLAEAAAHGAADRLRPIVSTGMTTIAGLVLLSFASPMWQPLCYAIIFGLVAATIISAFVVPCLFLLLAPKSLAGESDPATASDAASQPAE